MNNLVSIVCTTYNEEKLIAKTLESFLYQELIGMEAEILVVDGMSEDKTREIVKSYSEKYARIRLIDNPERKNPYGRNIGIMASKGEFIALLGAHAIYNSDYLKVCIEELERTKSIGAGGKVVPAMDNSSVESQLCELILTSKFGVSGDSFRTIKEGYTSMINYPVFKREVFDFVGLYDKSLHRNQDNDFNSRVIAKGYKLYNTWKTECKYYPSDTLYGTFSYASKNGFWNAKSMKHKPDTMMVHHYIPFIFVVTLIILAVAGIAGFFTKSYLPFLALGFVICLHLLIGFIFSIRIKKYRTFTNILSLPFLFFAFHFSYGWGTLKGFFRKAN